MPTVSIRDQLARLPGGVAGKTRTWQQVSEYLWLHYLDSDHEKSRREKFAERQRLYLGRGEQDIEDMINRVFQDPVVREKRRDWVAFAGYNNVLRRVILEQATVYSLPAKRTVGTAPALSPDSTPEEIASFDQRSADYDENNRRYNEVLRLCRFHEVMQRFNALLLLNRAVVIRPRMRQLPDGTWVPTIDLVTPSMFHAVRDPIDPTLCIALLFYTSFLLGDSEAQGPTWELLTWHERCWLNSRGHVMDKDATGQSLIDEHGFGRLPAILATIDPPDGTLLDEATGDDLVSAQKSVTFLQILMLKEAKSATKQHVITGDSTTVMRNQAADTDVPIQATDGTAVTTIDNSMDFMSFDEAARRVTESAAANHGVAAEVLNNAIPASADARELGRVPLRERRLQQHVPLREIEWDLANLLAVVVKQRRPDLAYDPTGWNIDFADPQTPLGTSEALDVLRKELDMGLSSELRALMDRNPDLSYEQAKQVLLQLIDDRTFRIEAMRAFMQASGGLPQAAVPTELRAVPNEDELEDKAA